LCPKIRWLCFSGGGRSNLSLNIHSLLHVELARLDHRICLSHNRDNRLQLDGYSRLFDLERLLCLIHLLAVYPKLGISDASTPEEFEAIVSPWPPGALAWRAIAEVATDYGSCAVGHADVQVSRVNEVDGRIASLKLLPRLGCCISSSNRPWHRHGATQKVETRSCWLSQR
jgi:hypothetical protein